MLPPDAYFPLYLARHGLSPVDRSQEYQRPFEQQRITQDPTAFEFNPCLPPDTSCMHPMVSMQVNAKWHAQKAQWDRENPDETTSALIAKLAPPTRQFRGYPLFHPTTDE